MMANKMTAALVAALPTVAATFGSNLIAIRGEVTPPNEVVSGNDFHLSVFIYQLVNHSTSSDKPGIELRTTGNSQSIPKGIDVGSIAMPFGLSCEFWKEGDSEGTHLNKVDPPGLNDTSDWLEQPNFFLCFTTGGSSASGTPTSSQTAATSSTGASSSSDTTASGAITGSSTTSSVTDSTLASQTTATTTLSRPTLLSCSATTTSVSSDTASVTMCACTSDTVEGTLSTIPGNSGDATAMCGYAFWPTVSATTASTTETTSLPTTSAAPASSESSVQPTSTGSEPITCSMFSEGTSFCNCLQGTNTFGVFPTLSASDDASKCAYTASPTSTSSTTTSTSSATTSSAAQTSTESSTQPTSTPTEASSTTATATEITLPATTITVQPRHRRTPSPKALQPPLLCTPIPSILPQLSTNLVTYTWTNIPPTPGLGSAVDDSACGILTDPATLNPPTRAIEAISTTCAAATLVIPTLTPSVAIVKGGGTVEYDLFCTVNSAERKERRWDLRTESSKAKTKNNERES